MSDDTTHNDGSAGWRDWSYRGSLLLAAVGVLVSLLPLLPVNQWWIRIGDYPRLQLLIGVAAAFAWVAFHLRRTGAKVAAAGLLVAAGVQTWFIFPYTPLASVESEDATRRDPGRMLSVFACNVLQDNDQYADVRRAIANADADVVLLMEVDQTWVEEVASALGEYGTQVLQPLDNTYGMAFYSRIPVDGHEVRHYIKEGIPSIVADVRLGDGTPVRVFCVHPNPPRPGEDTTKRDGELVLVARDVEERGGTTVVVGDMNDVGWSRTSKLFQKISRLLDPRKGRGFFNTFDAKSSVWRYPLDYVYHSDDFRLVSLQRLDPVGSDHYPLTITLSFEPDAEDEQEAPDKDPGDTEDAAEAVDNAKEAAAEEPPPTE